MKRSGLVCLIAVFILSGCAPEKKENTVSFYAMDTVMTVKGYGEADALKKAENRIKELDILLSSENENSDIYRINHSDGKEIPLSEDALKIIKKSCEYGEITGGAVDITLYPLVREWGFFSGGYNIPEKEKIENIFEKTGYENIKINGSSVTLPQGFAIDLGAAAKGYSGDETAKILKENGVDSAVITLGGNVRAVGEKPDGSPWKIAVCDPFSTNDYFCTLSVKDCSVVTSGDYQRYFIGEDGKKYCHIFDPKTGYPAESGVASATVIGRDGLACDLLSTAVFVMGVTDAEKLYRENGDFEMILVLQDGGLFVTEGIEAMTEIKNGKEYTVIHR